MQNAIHGKERIIMFENKFGRLLFFFLLVMAFFLLPHFVNFESEDEKEKCKLVEVLDGDTVSVIYQGEQASVRLIGIDTPESVHTDESKNNEYGKMASSFTRELLSDVEYLYLEFDISKYDTYERLLAYVYLDEEATFEESINFLLVAEGYALNKEFKPNIKHASALASACRTAKAEDKGLWSVDGIDAIWGK